MLPAQEIRKTQPKSAKKAQPRKPAKRPRKPLKEMSADELMLKAWKKIYDAEQRSQEDGAA